jgi:prepilin-type N-terminal cleavage/methylation domain-containing protein
MFPTNEMRNRRAFTLIELLVMIAVIAILAALLLPAMAAAKRRAKVTQCQNNFHQVYVASFVYANDYHDYFPIYGGVGNSIGWIDDACYVVFNAITEGGSCPILRLIRAFNPGCFRTWDIYTKHG